MADELVSLDAVKAQLRITNTDNDEQLLLYIAAATEIVEHYAGSVISRSVDEVVCPRGSLLVLSKTPVDSITAIEPVYVGGLFYDPTDFDIDTQTGVVRHRLQWSLVGPIRVTYVVGRTIAPENLQLAAGIIVQHMWTTQRGGSRRPGMGQSEDIIDQQLVSVMGYAIPRRAVELLQPHQQIGFA